VIALARALHSVPAEDLGSQTRFSPMARSMTAAKTFLDAAVDQDEVDVRSVNQRRSSAQFRPGPSASRGGAAWREKRSSCRRGRCPHRAPSGGTVGRQIIRRPGGPGAEAAGPNRELPADGAEDQGQSVDGLARPVPSKWAALRFQAGSPGICTALITRPRSAKRWRRSPRRRSSRIPRQLRNR